jgi:hypothetical protein
MEAIMEAKEVKAAAHGRWGGILSALAPQLQPALDRVGHHVSCPVHGGKDGYRVFNDVDDSGGSVCNTCGVHTDGFDTLMWVTGMDFKETLKSVAEYLRVGIVARPFGGRTISRQTRKGEDDEKARQALNRVWNASIALSHPDAEPARLYLARRGISIRQPGTLRLHPSLAYFEDRKEICTFPAMLAMVRGHGGNAITIHRTYLTADGYKAPVESPKKLMRYPSQRKLSGGHPTGGGWRRAGSGRRSGDGSRGHGRDEDAGLVRGQCVSAGALLPATRRESDPGLRRQGPALGATSTGAWSGISQTAGPKALGAGYQGQCHCSCGRDSCRSEVTGLARYPQS